MESIPPTGSSTADNPITVPKNHGARRKSNLPKILSMMAEGNNPNLNRKGTNNRDGRRHSNVFDQVDLIATLVAINHSTIDLNATTSIDADVLKANIISKGGVKRKSIEKPMVVIDEVESSDSDDSDDDKVTQLSLKMIKRLPLFSLVILTSFMYLS